MYKVLINIDLAMTLFGIAEVLKGIIILLKICKKR